MRIMGDHFAKNNYLFQLLNKPKITKINGVDIRILHQFLQGYYSKYGINASVHKKYLYQNEEDHSIHYFTSVRIGDDAIENRIEKLKDKCMIEEISYKEIRKAVTGNQLFDINLHKSKPYRITEFGIFCLLLLDKEYPNEMLSKYYRISKVLRTLLYPYFQKTTIEHATPTLHAALTVYLKESCGLINKALQDNENARTDDEKKEYSSQLEKDLRWETYSFALRTIFNLAPHSRNGMEYGQFILGNADVCLLTRDRKFMRLLAELMHNLNVGYEKMIRGDGGQKKHYPILLRHYEVT